VIRRPWTRLGVLAIGSHLAYELVAGVGVPLASRVGVTAWLTECEGLEDRLMGVYNGLLYVSTVAAVGGAVENCRAWRWFVATPLVVVPLLRRETAPEYRRLLTQAATRPRWWNRWLASRARGSANVD
jgi:hypothetical protein